MTSTATITDPTADDLVPLIGYARHLGEIPADFAYGRGTPEVGEVVWGFSRGGYRQGIVTKVTKTGTVSLTYVTEGGVKEYRDRAAKIAAWSPEGNARMASDQARKNYRYYASEAVKGLPYRPAYNPISDEEYAAKVAEHRASAAARLERMGDEDAYARAAYDKEYVHSTEAKAEAIANLASGSVNGHVNVTTKTIKVAEGVARRVS